MLWILTTDLRIRHLFRIMLFSSVFCLLRFEGTFTSVFKDKTRRRCKKIVEIRIFFYLLMEEFGSGAVQIMTDLHTGDQKHTVPDSDPQLTLDLIMKYRIWLCTYSIIHPFLDADCRIVTIIHAIFASLVFIIVIFV